MTWTLNDKSVWLTCKQGFVAFMLCKVAYIIYTCRCRSINDEWTLFTQHILYWLTSVGVGFGDGTGKSHDTSVKLTADPLLMLISGTDDFTAASNNVFNAVDSWAGNSSTHTAPAASDDGCTKQYNHISYQNSKASPSQTISQRTKGNPIRGLRC